MSIFEILILGTIIITCLVFIITYVTDPFKKENNNQCGNCPYLNSCSKSKK